MKRFFVLSTLFDDGIEDEELFIADSEDDVWKYILKRQDREYAWLFNYKYFHSDNSYKAKKIGEGVNSWEELKYVCDVMTRIVGDSCAYIYLRELSPVVTE